MLDQNTALKRDSQMLRSTQEPAFSTDMVKKSPLPPSYSWPCVDYALWITPSAPTGTVQISRGHFPLLPFRCTHIFSCKSLALGKKGAKIFQPRWLVGGWSLLHMTFTWEIFASGVSRSRLLQELLKSFENWAWRRRQFPRATMTKCNFYHKEESRSGIILGVRWFWGV